MKTDSIQAQNPSGVKPEAIDALVAFILVEASSIDEAQPHLDTIRAMSARIAELERAIAPFADLGSAFLKADGSDDSSWTKIEDSAMVQIGATKTGGWEISVKNFRRAARAALKDGSAE